MKYLSLTLFASTALAGPLSSLSLRSASSKSDVISRCENAVNCETYRDSKGTLRVRFKAGQEPGTEAFENLHRSGKVKRDGASTSVTLSDDTILWGCGVDVVSTLSHVGDVCKTSGSCLTSEPWSTTVDWADPDAGTSGTENLTLSATGNYPPWLRNGIVNAVQATFSAKGVIDTQDTTFQAIEGFNEDGPIYDFEPCTISKAPQEIDIVYFSAPNVMEATIQVIATVQPVNSGFCADGVAQGTALAAAIASAFGAWGAAIAGIFGTVSAVCGLDS